MCLQSARNSDSGDSSRLARLFLPAFVSRMATTVSHAREKAAASPTYVTSPREGWHPSLTNTNQKLQNRPWNTHLSVERNRNSYEVRGILSAGCCTSAPSPVQKRGKTPGAGVAGTHQNSTRSASYATIKWSMNTHFTAENFLLGLMSPLSLSGWILY